LLRLLLVDADFLVSELAGYIATKQQETFPVRRRGPCATPMQYATAI
jgi:hypothetical protein